MINSIKKLSFFVPKEALLNRNFVEEWLDRLVKPFCEYSLSEENLRKCLTS